MFHQSFKLPAPFYQLTLFSLVEPVDEAPGEITFMNRLYMADPMAEGGRRLLRQSRGGTHRIADLTGEVGA